MELKCKNCSKILLGFTPADICPKFLGTEYKCKECGVTFTAEHLIEETYGTTDKHKLINIDFKERTPLGPIPRFVHDGRRIKHLLKTLREFAEKETPIQVDWVDELTELLYKE